MATVRIVVTSLPGETPPGAAIHVASRDNGWNPGDAASRLSPAADGTWVLEIQVPARRALQFKLTRGSWDTVEKGSGGEELANRSVIVCEGGCEARVAVARWRDRGDPPRRHTLTGHVEVLHVDDVTQPANRRRVWVYLPPGYGDAGRRYPVLYLQDGQNVFDAATSFAGEWEVDKSLDAMSAGGFGAPIVVAVDHSGARRLHEYAPWYDDELACGGGGDAYLRFLVERVKAEIDARYRTAPGREHTGIAGSSAGGLLALYAGIRMPQVFSRIGALSPSLDLAEGAIFNQVRGTVRQHPTRIWLDVGADEGGFWAESRYLARLVRRMGWRLARAGFGPEELRVVVDPDGRHDEASWARRFPDAVRWLFP
jgi:predicted alpha/beta superfamily hydrolase